MKCGEEHHDAQAACWNCGTGRDGSEDVEFEPETSPVLERTSQRGRLECLRCRTALDYMGTRHFHEGARFGVFGDFGELFVKKQSYDVYVCSRCGHVEFFV